MDVTSRKRLSRSDWVEAGFRALMTGGPDAVAVEPLAARLEVTKGSGYWHFADRSALLTAVLDLWVQRLTVDVVTQVEAAGGPARDRMARLLALVTDGVEHSPTEMLVTVSPDPLVREAVERSLGLRLAYLRRLLEEAGVRPAEARARAFLAYSAYLGHATMAATVPSALPRGAAARRRMRAALLELAVPSLSE